MLIHEDDTGGQKTCAFVNKQSKSTNIHEVGPCYLFSHEKSK